jgi:hypothetical protein
MAHAKKIQELLDEQKRKIDDLKAQYEATLAEEEVCSSFLLASQIPR